MAYGEKIQCECAMCGAKWEAVKSKVRACCSRECSEKFRIMKMSVTKKPALAEKPCAICGVMFSFNPRTKRGRDRITCSRTCRGKTERVRMSGDDHHMKRPEQRAKVKATTIARHGGIGMAVPELATKTRDTMEYIYGVRHALQNPELVARARANTDIDAMVAKRKKSYYENRAPIYDIIETPEWWAANYTGDATIESLSADTGVSISKLYAVGSALGYEFKKRGGPSYIQMRLSKALMKFAYVESNTRKIIPPREIDIWLPEHNLAIEVNGLYWHTSDRLGNTYHRDKMRSVNAIGGRLMQFWDYEVAKKGDLITAMIRNACGMNDMRIGARKCEFIEVEKAAAVEFMESNHLQGDTGRNPRYIGLAYHGELVACMSIGPGRFRRDATEILRFAIKAGCSIPGAFTKLIKNSGVTGTIVSYSDNRYTTGAVYAAAGFRMVSDGTPTMWGTMDYDGLIPRQYFWGIKDWPGADPAITQIQNMQKLGYGVIHDAGQKTWVIDIPEHGKPPYQAAIPSFCPSAG